eukprot:TRINITY_DN5858_c0_g1_i2.p1 TRINITY_DN5858_c0_g1~~TRINITY_DN5858_c0_g1_i2.p1  ORF type:complete len:263 (+),score=49.03 TRINITY_DN5858_c0_g1_i2:85-873(+)
MDKRFIFVVIVGLLCVCLAQAEYLVEEEISDQQDVAIEESSDEVAETDRWLGSSVWSKIFAAQDCRLSGWSEWSTCTKPCGGGTKTKTRTVVAQPKNGGRKCGSLTWTTWCNEHHCPIDCKYTEWTAWTACQTCGIQTRARQRIPAQYGGKACTDQPLDESRLCPTDYCKECVYGAARIVPEGRTVINRKVMDKFEAPLLFAPRNVQCDPSQVDYRPVSGGMGDGRVVAAFESVMAPVPEPSPFAESVFLSSYDWIVQSIHQ